MRSLKINWLLPIYISTLPLKFGADIQSQSKVSPETKKSNMATRRPFWKWRRWKSIGSYPYIQVLCHLSLQLIFKAKLKLESGNQKFQHGCLAAILKLTLLKINRLLHIYISIVPLKFGVDIQSQTKVRVWKPKNPIWPPGGHFESDLAENQLAFANDHHQHAYEVWNWNSKANLTYIPETLSPIESRNRKILYGRQAAILKMTLLKINRLLPMYISIVLLKFEVDIQSQSKVRVRKPKNPIWPPGGHFESDIAENQ